MYSLVRNKHSLGILKSNLSNLGAEGGLQAVTSHNLHSIHQERSAFLCCAVAAKPAGRSNYQPHDTSMVYISDSFMDCKSFSLFVAGHE